MRVEKKPIAPAHVDSATFEFGRDAWDGFWEIGVNGEFGFGDTFGSSGLWIVGDFEVFDGLEVGFAPKIVKRNGVFGTVETPQPIMRYRRIESGANV